MDVSDNRIFGIAEPGDEDNASQYVCPPVSLNSQQGSQFSSIGDVMMFWQSRFRWDSIIE